MVDRLGRDEPRDYVEAPDFDPDVLTIGFARRLATYKRLHVLLQSAEGIVDLLSGERKIQILIAGKAHPRDDDGKRSLQALFAAKGIPEIGCRVAYLDDYDLTIGARLVTGCDVWVNLPRPPLEASGTSGMKSAANGGLQLSVLDGWWAEGYDGTQRLGAVRRGRRRPRRAGRPRRRRAAAPAPRRGRARPSTTATSAGCRRRGSRSCARRCAPTGREFSATRMVRDYGERIYG